jgi:hypothetical protein
MREQRWNMVKRQVQYSFIYDYLERWVRKHYFDLVLLNKDDFAESNASSSAKGDDQ